MSARCGDGGGTSSGGGEAPAFDLTGVWNGKWNSGLNSRSGFLSMTVNQIGNEFTAGGSFSRLRDCSFFSSNATGSISGNQVNFTFGVTVPFTGTVHSATSMSGSYAFQNGKCLNDTGSSTLKKIR